MDQVAAIGSTETRQPPSALDWDAFIQEVRPRLVAAGIARFGLTRSESEDMAQQTILRAMHLAPRIRDPIAYLKVAFLNTCRNEFRARSRHREGALEVDVCDSRVDRQREAVEAAWSLQVAFAAVSPRCRQLVRVYFLQENSLEETATTTGYSRKTVWKRIQACLRKMRECLA
jgi:RNA polymerase sigma factor (sigma-70 family)